MIPSDKNIFTENYERPGTADARQQLYGNRTNEILSRGSRSTQENSAFQPYIKPYEGADRGRERTAFSDNAYAPEVRNDNYQRKQYSLYDNKADTDYDVKPFSDTTYVPAPSVNEERVRTRVAGEDLMPSIRTMSYAEEEKQQKVKPAKKVSYRTALDKRGKVMLALYISFVTILLTAIIVSGIMVAKAGKRVDTLNGRLETQQTILSSQNSDIAASEQIDNINQIANEMGFEYNGGGATSIQVVELGAATEYAPITNWFDRLCDWLSGLVGG